MEIQATTQDTHSSRENKRASTSNKATINHWLLTGPAPLPVSLRMEHHFRLSSSSGPTQCRLSSTAELPSESKQAIAGKWHYYLGDMLRADGDADAAVETRIRIVWNKFRQSVPLLTNMDISLIRRNRLGVVCKVVCYTEVRPGLSVKKMRWHFSKHR